MTTPTFMGAPLRATSRLRMWWYRLVSVGRRRSHVEEGRELVYFVTRNRVLVVLGFRLLKGETPEE